MNDPSINTYHNASTPPKPEEKPELSAFNNAVDGVLAHAAELARVVANAHQGAATQLVGGDWSGARKYFSLSEKYAAWTNYKTSAVGFGIHSYLLKANRPLRLTQAELEAHPEWRGFGTEAGKHPPMRGWLTAPLVGSDGLNYGLLQASDRTQGDFTETDESQLVRLAALTSAALDALALVYLPEYQQKMLPGSAKRPGEPAPPEGREP